MNIYALIQLIGALVWVTSTHILTENVIELML
jgi:hypothetical protein